MNPIGRRTFLGAALAGVAGLRLRPSFPRARRAATPADLVGALFSDAAGARRLGTLYLQQVPAEASETALITVLTPEGEDPAQWWAEADVDDLRKEARRRAHADFDAGDVVDLGGWQLARTEARLTALWTVTHPA